jgi:hypothetical protein
MNSATKIRLGKRKAELQGLIRDNFPGADVTPELIPVGDDDSFMLRVAGVQPSELLRSTRPIVDDILLHEAFAIFVVPVGRLANS